MFTTDSDCFIYLEVRGGKGGGLKDSVGTAGDSLRKTGDA